jgi:hypothetical protein
MNELIFSFPFASVAGSLLKFATLPKLKDTKKRAPESRLKGKFLGTQLWHK